MSWRSIRAGFKPMLPKVKPFIQQEFFCEGCQQVSEEETIYNEKERKYLCLKCRP